MEQASQARPGQNPRRIRPAVSSPGSRTKESLPAYATHPQPIAAMTASRAKPAEDPAGSELAWLQNQGLAVSAAASAAVSAALTRRFPGALGCGTFQLSARLKTPSVICMVCVGNR